MKIEKFFESRVGNELWYINVYTYVVVMVVNSIVFNELYRSTEELYSGFISSGWVCLMTAGLRNYIPVIIVGIIVKLIWRKPLRESGALFFSILPMLFFVVIEHITLVNGWAPKMYVGEDRWSLSYYFYVMALNLSLIIGIMTSYKMLRSNNILGSLFSFDLGKK